VKLLRLTFSDFMAYKGDHSIDFEVSDLAPIILFLGENGHGKSTIQHAARWCLYGETSDRGVAIPVSKMLNRKSLMEASEVGSLVMSVSMRWSDSGHIFDLVRSWSPGKKSGDETHAILRIDGGNPVPEMSIPEYVQRFLAKEISHFFFFNGEVQDEFDAMVSNARSASFIRNEIEKTLSIPVVTSGIDWLNFRKDQENEAIVKANKSNKKIAAAGKSLEEERHLKQTFVEELKVSEADLARAVARLDQLEEEIGNIQAVEGLMKDINFLRGTRKSQKTERRYKMEEICELLSTNPWIPDASGLLRLQRENADALEQATRLLDENNSIQQSVDLLERLRTEEKCPLCFSRHETTPENVVARIEVLRASLKKVDVLDLDLLKKQKSLLTALHVSESVVTNVRNLQKDFNALGSDLATTEQKLSELNTELALHGDVDVTNAVMSLKSLTSDQKSAEYAIGEYAKNIAACDLKISRLISEIASVKNVSPEKQAARAAYNYLAQLFEDAKDKYTSAVKQQVEKYASETFMNIISDKKYAGLRINDNYGVDLVMKDGDVDSLRSTGQGKVGTLSLVSGLIKTAMPDGFILMDTPFVSLDLGHREQVCRWAAKSGLHVSLFMHSGEWNDTVLMGFFDGRVGRIFRIEQIDTNESTIRVEV
jgi:DNA sulfur modification protein DndD